MTLTLGIAVSLAACGQQAEQAPAAPAETGRTVTGVAAKGPLSGATVSFFAMDAAGNPVGSALAVTATSSAGQFTVDVPQGAALLAVTSGGSYLDESDTDSSDGQRAIALGSNGLRAVLAAEATTLVITPYTQALYRKAQLQAAGTNFPAVYAAVVGLSGGIFGFDVTTVIPANPLSPSGSASQIQYAMLLGGAANAINALALGAGSLPTFAHISAFIEDLADGRWDAGDLNAEITRFRNNNFSAFGGTPLPVVDEDAFAEPAPVDNQPPVATDDAITTGRNAAVAIEAASLLANDSDADGGTLTIASVSAPVGGTVALADGTITFTPTAGFVGAAGFLYTLEDGQGGSDSATVAVTVVNQTPVAVGDAAATLEDTPVTITLASLLGNDTDADGDSLSFGAASNPVNGAVAAAAGGASLIFSPTADFAGTASFDYTVSDGVATATGTVTVTVTAVNDAPTIAAIANPAAIPANSGAQTVNVSGIAAGGGETQTLTIGAVSDNTALIPNPTVTYSSPNTTGSLSYTPVAGAFGTAIVTVTVTDNGGTANGGDDSTSTSFTVTVNEPVNTAPSITSSAFSVPENQTTIGTVQANDSDTPPQPLSFSLAGGPDAALFAITSGGALSFLGARDFEAPADVGADNVYNVTVAVSDGNGGNDTQAIAVTVTNVADQPLLPLRDGRGNLKLFQPDAAVGTGNPLQLAAGVPARASDFEGHDNYLSFVKASVTGGIASNIHFARLVWLQNGRVFVVPLDAGSTAGPRQVSSISDACELGHEEREDLADPDLSGLEVWRAGPDGECQSGDETQAYLRLNMTASDAPIALSDLGINQILEELNGADGSLIGFLTLEFDPEFFTPQLVRRDAALQNPALVATLGTGEQVLVSETQQFNQFSAQVHWETKGLSLVYLAFTPDNESQLRLHRYDVAAGTITALDFVFAQSFGCVLCESTYDGSNFYFEDNNGIYRVAHSAAAGTAPALLATGADDFIADMGLTSAAVIFETGSGVRGDGNEGLGIYAVPKAGGTVTTLRLGDVFSGVSVLLNYTDPTGNRVFINEESFGEIFATTAVQMTDDGLNVVETFDSSWSGGNFATSFNVESQDDPAAAALLRATQIAGPAAQLDSVDPQTGLLLHTLGSVAGAANLKPAAAEGFGRYIPIGVFGSFGLDVFAHNDLYIADAHKAGSLVPISTVAGADDNWLHFEDFQGQGGGSGACIAPPADMVAWYPGDNGAYDIVGGNHAELRNGAGFASGIVQSAFALDGVDDYVNVAHAANLNFGTGDFTVDLWVLFDSLTVASGEQILIEKYVETTDDGRSGWSLTKFNDNRLRLALPGPITNAIDSAPLNITAGTWHHYAVRRSGDQFTLLVDGTVVASATRALTLNSTASLKLGHRGSSTDTDGSLDDRGFHLDGLIDEVEVFNRALSDAEIQSIYGAGAPGKCRPDDGDSLSSEEEAAYGTNPNDADTDDDGLSDSDEAFVYGTEPTNPDTDGDGFGDGDEVNNGAGDGNPLFFPNTNPVFDSQPLLPTGLINGTTGLGAYAISDAENVLGDDLVHVTFSTDYPAFGAIFVREDVANGIDPLAGDTIWNNGSGLVTVVAPLNRVNTTLAAGDGVQFIAPSFDLYTGAQAILVQVDDMGHGSDYATPGFVATTTMLRLRSFELDLIAPATGAKLQEASAGAQLGGPVTAAGDVNGDGFADVLIVAEVADGTAPDAGKAYVLFGPLSEPLPDLATLDGTKGFVLNGPDAATIPNGGTTPLGMNAAAGAGDVNGDGFDDIVIGVREADPDGRIDAGRTYVVFGAPTGTWFDRSGALDLAVLDGSNGFVLNGIDADDISGQSVAGAGDVNGDGYADVLIGARAADPFSRNNAGESYLVFGKASFASGTVELSALGTAGTEGVVIFGGVAEDFSGTQVAGAGDVNNDGYDDILLNGPGRDFAPNTDAGVTHLVYGGPNLPATIDIAAGGGVAHGIRGINAGDANGEGGGLGGADVNGDGYSDILIGAFAADPGGRTGAGRSYVVFGGPSLPSSPFDLSSLNGTNGFMLNGATAGDRSAIIGRAGDIDGDGLQDIFIGGRGGDVNGDTDAGIAHIVYGRFGSAFPPVIELSALDGSDGFAIHGVDAGDNAGSGGRAGDLNADGFDDLVIGARFADAGGVDTKEGEAYLIFGGDFRRDGNDGPLASDDFYTVTENVALSVPGPLGVLRNDADPDDVLFSPVIINVGIGQLSLNSDGSFTYTPALDSFGPDVWRYEICDAFSCSQADITFDVKADTDGDGLSDADESSLGTHPNDADTDDDGLGDGDEVKTHGTDPTNADTDGDGLKDNDELGGDGVLDAVDTDPAKADTDGDGVPDGVELEAGSDALVANSVIFVDAGNTACSSGCNGTSWAAAFSDQASVAAAIGAGGTASSPLFVLYAPGTYEPMTLTGADRSFVTVVGSLGSAASRPNKPATTIFSGGGTARPMTLGQVFDVTFSDIEFTGGSASNGGGIYIEDTPASGTLNLRRVTIANNTAAGDGGGLASYNNGAINIYDSEIRDNTASGGTSFPRGGGLTKANGSIHIEDSLISGNFVDGLAFGAAQGGGLVFQSTTATVINSIIAANEVRANPGATNVFGGGVHADNSALTVQHSQIVANRSMVHGGGLNVANASSTLALFNNLIVGNLASDTANATGGGVRLSGSNPANATFHSNTVAYNQTASTITGTGGGGYFDQTSNVDFVNNIFRFNDNGTVGGAYQSGDNLVDTASAGALSYARNNVGGETNPDGIDQDPLFVAGFYLNQSASPSVNTGHSLAPSAPFTTDPTGAVDVNPDMGFHHAGASTGDMTALSDVLPSAGSDIGCGSFVTFKPMAGTTPLGAGRLIVVEITGGSLTSLTTLDPHANNSRIARDLGDGRYEVVIPLVSSSIVTLNVYADDNPTPQAIGYSAFCA